MNSLTKKVLACICICFAFVSEIYSQHSPAVTHDSFYEAESTPPCYSDELLKQAIAENPELKTKIEEREAEIQKYIASSGSKRISSAMVPADPLIIPVVVHILYDNTYLDGNISKAQIDAQINALNQAFANNSINIKFCLATNPAPGYSWTNPAEPGITRHLTSLARISADNTGLSALSFVSYFPPDQYLNIWVVRAICPNYNTDCSNDAGQILGVAPFPFAPNGFLDGIVIRADVFGDNTSSNAYYLRPGNHQGKVLVHEVGHYLGLYHVFHDACPSSSTCATTGDRVCDTPPVPQKINSCSGIKPSCIAGTNALLDNFMEWTPDACMSKFTNGQRDDRIIPIINLYRKNLVSGSNLATVGVSCLPAGLIADFTVDSRQVCSTKSAVFTYTTDPAANVSHWEWYFPGSTTPGPVYGKGPHSVTYNTAGNYDVTLTVKNANGDVTSATRKYWMFVTQCNPITSVYGNWFFGYSCALSFSTGAPVKTSALPLNTTYHGSASYSDPATGNLLFLTNGKYVHNGTHYITGDLNGTPSTSGDYPTGVIIVPHPGNPNRYYIFNTTSYSVYKDNMSLNNGLCYTIIDMSVTNPSGSKGVVVSGTLNTPVVAGNNPKVADVVAAIPACNGTDYWIIVEGAEGIYADKILAFRLTPSGLQPPVISQSHHRFVGPEVHESKIKAAPNGKRVVFAHSINSDLDTYPTALYNFDKTTGVFSFVTILASFSNGVAFSPSSDMLYISLPSGIRQYDLTTVNACNPTPDFTRLPANSGGALAQLQLGPDGKIYETEPTVGLSIINYPDVKNNTANPNACGYNYNAISYLTDYPTGIYPWYSLPNVIDAKKETTPNFDYCLKNCYEANFTSNTCGTSYSWNFGDGSLASPLENPVHTYPTTPATYTVTLTVTRAGSTPPVVTHTKTLTILPPPAVPSILGPAIVCQSESPAVYSTPEIAGLKYTWTITGGQPATASGPVINVIWNGSGTGTIRLEAVNANGCLTPNTMSVTIRPAPEAYTGPDVGFCLGGSITLGKSPVTGNTYSWTSVPGTFTSSSSQITVTPTVTTRYYLEEVIPSTGCKRLNTVKVTIFPLPDKPLVSQTNNCSTVLLETSLDASLTYQWKRNGTVIPSTYLSTYTATSNGTYTVVVTNSYNCKTESDPVAVTGITSPVTFHYSNYTLTGTQAWSVAQFPPSGMVYIAGTFTIAKGAILNIGGGLKVEFAPGARMVVEQGGRLVLNGCTLQGLTVCNNMWEGIEVWGRGNSEPNFSYHSQGKLIMRNGAVIQDAHNAVVLGRLCNNGSGQFCYDPAQTRGNLDAEGCTFKNNGIAVRFIDHYFYFSNLSNCTIIGGKLKDPKYNTSITPASDRYPNSTFPNYAKSNSLGRGSIGIYASSSPSVPTAFINFITNALDSLEAGIVSYGVPIFTNNVYDNNVPESTFKNMKYGVKVFALPSMRLGTSVFKTNFDNIDTTSVYVVGDMFTKVHLNGIEDNTRPTTQKTSTGIFFVNTSRYDITDNLMWAQERGVVADNAGTDVALIGYRTRGNTITNSKVSVQTQGQNKLLKITCNNYLPALITSSEPYTNNWNILGTLENQGMYVASQPTNKRNPAGNEFRQGARKQIQSATAQFTYYRHSAPANVIPVPNSNITVSANPVAKTNGSCPAGSFLPMFGLRPYLEQVQDTIKKYKTEYERVKATIDHGLTDVLLLLTRQLDPLNPIVGPFVEAVLAASPLSDTVLYEILKKVPPLSPNDIKEIILANSPVSPKIKPMLDTVIRPFTATIKQEIQEAQVVNNVRTLTAIQREIGYFDVMYSLGLNDFTWEALTDSSGRTEEFIPDSSDRAIAYFEADTTPGREKVLVSLYLGRGRYAEAQARLNEIIPTSQQEAAYKEIMQMSIDMAQAGQTWFDLPEVKVNYLWMVADNYPRSLAGSYAQNILRLIRGADFPAIIDEAPDGSRKYTGSNKTGSYLGENRPNPFNNTTVIPYYLKDENSPAFIKVYNITGQLVREFRLVQGNNIMEMQRGKLPAGLYVYTMEIGGVVTDNKKMVLSR
jgi:PKD repeat protein